jgi:hypothetical protein
MRGINRAHWFLRTALNYFAYHELRIIFKRNKTWSAGDRFGRQALHDVLATHDVICSGVVRPRRFS